MSALRQAFTELRAESGMTYDELAEITGLSRRTLLNIGAGTYHGDLRTWLILTRALGLSLDGTLAPVWSCEDPRKRPGAEDRRRGL